MSPRTLYVIAPTSSSSSSMEAKKKKKKGDRVTNQNKSFLITNNDNDITHHDHGTEAVSTSQTARRKEVWIGCGLNSTGERIWISTSEASRGWRPARTQRAGLKEKKKTLRKQRQLSPCVSLRKRSNQSIFPASGYLLAILMGALGVGDAWNRHAYLSGARDRNLIGGREGERARERARERERGRERAIVSFMHDGGRHGGMAGPIRQNF